MLSYTRHLTLRRMFGKIWWMKLTEVCKMLEYLDQKVQQFCHCIKCPILLYKIPRYTRECPSVFTAFGLVSKKRWFTKLMIYSSPANLQAAQSRPRPTPFQPVPLLGHQPSSAGDYRNNQHLPTAAWLSSSLLLFQPWAPHINRTTNGDSQTRSTMVQAASRRSTRLPWGSGSPLLTRCGKGEVLHGFERVYSLVPKHQLEILTFLRNGLLGTGSGARLPACTHLDAAFVSQRLKG